MRLAKIFDFFSLFFVSSIAGGGRAYCDNISAFSIDSLYSSGLPILFIDLNNNEFPTADRIDHPVGCVGGTITNCTTVNGRAYMVYNKVDTLYDSGRYLKDVSGISLRIRGNGSGRREKAAYKLKLEKKADLISGDNTFKDKNWLLKFDQNMFPHIIPTLKINELIGMSWTPRYKWVHVMLNQKYWGLYQIHESLRRNPGARIDVGKTGYIVEYDAYWWNEDVYFETPYHNICEFMKYTFKYPDPDEITADQYSYVQESISSVEKSLYNGTYDNFMDVESFARWLLAHDILGSHDAAGSNMFLIKYDNSKNSKVKMVCLWDYDTIMQSKDSWSASHNFFYFPLLFSSSNKKFIKTYIDIWNREGASIIDSTINYLKTYKTSKEGQILKKSLELNHDRWSWLPVDFDDYLNNTIKWLEERKVWMDNEISALKSTLSCDSVVDETNSVEDIRYYDILGREVENPHGRIIKKSLDGRYGIVVY
ncbi:MAG: CotH kinase family protein [Bacteroidaceae bacterium]|nr:CotH kinase family protein [Bacteroidaceae bacterium]